MIHQFNFCAIQLISHDSIRFDSIPTLTITRRLFVRVNQNNETSMNNLNISCRCTLSLKIPCLERNHRDADRINRSCLQVCVRLSLQISLSYAIFIIMIFLYLTAAFAV